MQQRSKYHVLYTHFSGNTVYWVLFVLVDELAFRARAVAISQFIGVHKKSFRRSQPAVLRFDLHPFAPLFCDGTVLR